MKFWGKFVFSSSHQYTVIHRVNTGSNFLSRKSIIFKFLLCVFQILCIDKYFVLPPRAINIADKLHIVATSYKLFTLRKFIILRRAQ